MTTRRLLPRSFAAAALALVAAGAQAAPAIPLDPVGACFLRATTAEQRAVLVRWIFAMGALNPDVQSIATVSDAQRERANRDAAALVQRLLLEACRSEAVQAVRTQGLDALQRSFTSLSQVAIQELFNDPRVAAGIAGMVPYLDLPALLELGASLR